MAVQDITTPHKCSVEGCDRPKDTRGYCLKHYKWARRNKIIQMAPKPVYPDLCAVEGCGKKQEKRGYCDKHYRRIQRKGTLELERQPSGSHYKTGEGYFMQRHNGKARLVHVLIAEKALGKPLPEGAEVHHVNRIRDDNRNENLVICPDRAYHMLLHYRQKALDACGNPNWMPCRHCREYDDPSNGTVTRVNMRGRSKTVAVFYHKECASAYQRDRKKNHGSKISKPTERGGGD